MLPHWLHCNSGYICHMYLHCYIGKDCPGALWMFLSTLGEHVCNWLQVGSIAAKGHFKCRLSPAEHVGSASLLAYCFLAAHTRAHKHTQRQAQKEKHTERDRDTEKQTEGQSHTDTHTDTETETETKTQTGTNKQSNQSTKPAKRNDNPQPYTQKNVTPDSPPKAVLCYVYGGPSMCCFRWRGNLLKVWQGALHLQHHIKYYSPRVANLVEHLQVCHKDPHFRWSCGV